MAEHTFRDVSKGKRFRLRGYVRDGRKPRDLSNDQIEFALADPETFAASVTKTSGAGISQGSDGAYIIEVPGYEMQLPKYQYYFEVQIILGDSGDIERLESGTVYLTPSPFAL